MMTVEDRVLAEIKQKSGRTEREIAEALFGRGARQQRVNPYCRAFAEQGLVERRGAGGNGDPFTYYPVER